MDVFSRAAITPHLEQRRVPIRYSWSAEAATLLGTSWNVRQPCKVLQPLLATPY